MFKFIDKLLYGIYFITLISLCSYSCTPSIYKTEEDINPNLSKVFTSKIQEVFNSFDQGLEIEKSLPRLNYEFCELKDSGKIEISDKFFNLLLNSSYFNHSERIYLFNHSKYCFSEKEKENIRVYLSDNLETSDMFYYDLISFYGLGSLLTSESTDGLQSLDTLFGNISKSFSSGYISSLDKSDLELYAVLVNLGRVSEDLYLQKLMEIYYETLENNPEYLDVFYYEILQHSLKRLLSKKSIIKTIDFLSTKNLVHNKRNNAHIQTISKEGSDSNIISSNNEEHGFCGGSSIESLASNYFNFCVFPKIVPNNNFLVWSADVEANLSAIKNSILYDSDHIWKLETTNY